MGLGTTLSHSVSHQEDYEVKVEVDPDENHQHSYDISYLWSSSCLTHSYCLAQLTLLLNSLPFLDKKYHLLAHTTLGEGRNIDV